MVGKGGDSVTTIKKIKCEECGNSFMGYPDDLHLCPDCRTRKFFPNFEKKNKGGVDNMVDCERCGTSIGDDYVQISLGGKGHVNEDIRNHVFCRTCGYLLLIQFAETMRLFIESPFPLFIYKITEGVRMKSSRKK